MTTPLEEALSSVDAMTEDQIAKTMRLIGRRGWEASQELNGITRRMGEVNADAQHKLRMALIESHVEHPDRKVAHHKAIAEEAAGGELAEVFALTLMERSLRTEISLLERLVFSLNAQWKRMVETPFERVGS